MGTLLKDAKSVPSFLSHTFRCSFTPTQWKPLSISSFQANELGRGSTVACPPRSPDLTSLAFFLCGCIKYLVCQTWWARCGRTASPNNCSVWGCYTSDAAKLLARGGVLRWLSSGLYVAACGLIHVYQRIRGPYCLHQQGDGWATREIPVRDKGSKSVKTELGRICAEGSTNFRNVGKLIRCYNPEEGYLRTPCRKNPKSYTVEYLTFVRLLRAHLWGCTEEYQNLETFCIFQRSSHVSISFVWEI
jgi:hypothetical protein